MFSEMVSCVSRIQATHLWHVVRRNRSRINVVRVASHPLQSSGAFERMKKRETTTNKKRLKQTAKKENELKEKTRKKKKT